ncbi:Putative flavin carrier protein 3 [Purpureocillium takamizusanense]|uniref:Flavin carrier protein 3 n=1 Tax=Purpureocillium takamizusanense TaxID=2060973 RepID=A0A9Q8QGY1_9HYPO|nr:Putative flavin carrier protein 3 [Purpureocillium takamizusanense]UNI19498.1 Putative flavin carrier protein 3 [Purpureocillium takamizusanense]
MCSGHMRKMTSFTMGLPSMLVLVLSTFLSSVTAERLLMSNSLNACQQDSSFKASLFNVVYTPSNNSANIQIIATSSIQGKVLFDLAISAYGYQVLRRTLNPCEMNLPGLCPMVAGKIPLGFALPVGEEASKQIPGIAYNIPDLDARVKVYVNLSSTGESLACLEADISNGKTVDLLGVKWATAIIAGLALISSAIVNGLGNPNAAAHLAANSLALFGYFQAQAILGLTGVALPPIVQAWAMDFQWSMGIIRVKFMQKIFTWYQRATGGTPATIFDSITTVSVQVAKRAIKRAAPVSQSGISLFNRGLASMPASIAQPAAKLLKRGNIVSGSGSYLVYGIQRVAFRSRIESTNLFMTGLTFFYVFVLLTVLIVAAFKGIFDLCAKKGWIGAEKFLEFRNGWLTVLKGILFRVVLIGFPQICILCFWEFTQVDSPAEVVLAAVFSAGMIITLGWGASKVIRIARRSIVLHQNPAYILFSDPQTLNKWGFLYIQFRASAYYFIAPVLGYIVVKAMLVAFAQNNGVAQAIGFVIVEAAALIAASVLRPWMDKSTNSFNIAICAVNFINAIFLLIFANKFGAPLIVVGAVGVALFILNAAFSLILLIMVITSTTITLFRRNPDSRYQIMADDRASFMKSQTQLNTTTELDALAATARGDKTGYNTGYKHPLDLDEDDLSVRSETGHLHGHSHSARGSPVPSRHRGTPMPGDSDGSLFSACQRPESPFHTGSPGARPRTPSSPDRAARSNLNTSPALLNPPRSPSSWQRGAGYERG